MVAESISGTIRSLWLIPAVGEVRAGQIGFVVGVIIVITTAWLFIRWMRPRQTIRPVGDWFAVGSADAGVRGRTGASGSQLFLGTNGVGL